MGLILRHSRLVRSVQRPVAVIGSWTTTQLAQSVTVKATAGAIYGVNWGDGVNESFVGNGASQVHLHTYGSAGTYRQTWTINDSTKLEMFQANIELWVGSLPTLRQFTALTSLDLGNNQLTGPIPDLSANTGLTGFNCYLNHITGSIPSLSTNTALVNFSCYYNYTITGTIPSVVNNIALGFLQVHLNQLTGTIPSLATNTLLRYAYFYSNLLTGTIPSLTANAILVAFGCDSNQLTGYTASTLAATLTTFNAATNQLPQAAIDQILADFATGVAGRPAVGTITLNGVGNAAPSAAGLASKAAILAAKPGWTILHN